MDTQQIKAFITTHHKVITVICAALILLLVFIYASKNEGFAYTDNMRDAYRQVREFKRNIRNPNTQADWGVTIAKLVSSKDKLVSVADSVDFNRDASDAWKQTVRAAVSAEVAAIAALNDIYQKYDTYQEKEKAAPGTIQAIVDTHKSKAEEMVAQIKDLVDKAKAEEAAATPTVAEPATAASPASYLRNRNF
jgi:hypothetical protein